MTLSSSNAGSPIPPGSAKFLAPAFGVPVAPGIHVVLWYDHQVPRSFANHVIAARASVGLLPADMAHVEAGNRRPFRCGSSSRRCLRFFEELWVTPVLARHQPLLLGMCARMNAAATDAMEAPTSRGSSFRESSKECPPPSMA